MAYNTYYSIIYNNYRHFWLILARDRALGPLNNPGGGGFSRRHITKTRTESGYSEAPI